MVVYYWADLQSVYGFCCYDNIAPNRNGQRVLVLALCLVIAVMVPTWLSVNGFAHVHKSYSVLTAFSTGIG